MQTVSLKLVKPGLLNGVRTRFYTWSEGAPPREPGALPYIAETISPRIDFTWFDKPHEKVPSKRFIAEFKGFIKIDYPGTYRFYVVSSDGAILSVDGRVLVDAWFDQPPRLHSSPEIVLGRGYRRIRLLYYNRDGIGEVTLGWIRPDGVAESIPSDRYYFSIGEHAFITGLPDGYVVRLLPLRDEALEKQCVSVMNICMVSIPWEEQPLEAYLSIYRGSGEVFARFTEPVTLFGGDEYSVYYAKH